MDHRFLMHSSQIYVWSMIAFAIRVHCRPSNFEQYWTWIKLNLPNGELVYTVGLAAVGLPWLSPTSPTPWCSGALVENWNAVYRRGCLWTYEFVTSLCDLWNSVSTIVGKKCLPSYVVLCHKGGKLDYMLLVQGSIIRLYWKIIQINFQKKLSK